MSMSLFTVSMVVFAVVSLLLFVFGEYKRVKRHQPEWAYVGRVIVGGFLILLVLSFVLPLSTEPYQEDIDAKQRTVAQQAPDDQLGFGGLPQTGRLVQSTAQGEVVQEVSVYGVMPDVSIARDTTRVRTGMSASTAIMAAVYIAWIIVWLLRSCFNKHLYSKYFHRGNYRPAVHRTYLFLGISVIYLLVFTSFASKHEIQADQISVNPSLTPVTILADIEVPGHVIATFTTGKSERHFYGADNLYAAFRYAESHEFIAINYDEHTDTLLGYAERTK